MVYLKRRLAEIFNILAQASSRSDQNKFQGIEDICIQFILLIRVIM